MSAISLLDLPHDVLVPKILAPASLGLQGAASSCQQLCSLARQVPGVCLTVPKDELLSAPQLPAHRAFTSCRKLRCTVDVSNRRSVAGWNLLCQHAAVAWPGLTTLDLTMVNTDVETAQASFSTSSMSSSSVCSISPAAKSGAAAAGLLPAAIRCSSAAGSAGSLTTWSIEPTLQVLLPLTHLRSLRSLSVTASTFSSSSLDLLGALDHLQQLHLTALQPEGANLDLRVLSALSQLQVLTAVGFTPAAGTLPNSPPPVVPQPLLPRSVVTIDIEPCGSVKDWLPLIFSCGSHLRQLRISYPAAAQHLYCQPPYLIEQLASSCSLLERLDLHSNTTPTWQGGLAFCNVNTVPGLVLPDGLQRLPHLKRLAITGQLSLCCPAEHYWRQLAACPALEHLQQLTASVAPPEGVTLQPLTSLVLTSDTAVEMRTQVQASCPALQRLEVNH